jgi:hypothetical protein
MTMPQLAERTPNMYTQSTGFRRIRILIAIAICFVGLMGLLRTRALSDTGMHTGPNGAYCYFVENTGEGLDIGVTIDTRDPNAWNRYLQLNDDRNQLLIESRSNERLFATITFSSPLPLQEVSKLLIEAQVEPVDYTQVGWTASGQRLGSTIWANPDRRIADLAVEAVTATSEDEPVAGARMAGFLVVSGYIAVSDESLGKLLADERVYVVDTTAWEIQQALGPASRNAAFSLPTPFWGMDWNQ